MQRLKRVVLLSVLACLLFLFSGCAVAVVGGAVLLGAVLQEEEKQKERQRLAQQNRQSNNNYAASNYTPPSYTPPSNSSPNIPQKVTVSNNIGRQYATNNAPSPNNDSLSIAPPPSPVVRQPSLSSEVFVNTEPPKRVAQSYQNNPVRNQVAISRDFVTTKEKARFLLNEMEKMSRILSSYKMEEALKKGNDELLERGKLVSWFDLERPDSQSVYYELLDIPVSRNGTQLNRTKSQLLAMSEEERRLLKVYIDVVLKNLRQEVSAQSNNAEIGLSYSAVP